MTPKKISRPPSIVVTTPAGAERWFDRLQAVQYAIDRAPATVHMDKDLILATDFITHSG